MCAFFGSEPEATRVIPADPMAFPDASDVALARKGGAFYGQPMDGFSRGQHFRLTGSPAGMYTDEVTDPSRAAYDSASNAQVADAMTRAALAANRVPLAALGFDPRNMQIAQVPNSLSVAGAYSPDRDVIFSAFTNDEAPSNVSTPVHEAIHRGLEKVRSANPALGAEFDGYDEEDMVRYIMQTQVGDPERDPQADRVRGVLAKRPEIGTKFGGMAQRLNDEAARMWHEQRPFGGPR